MKTYIISLTLLLSFQLAQAQLSNSHSNGQYSIKYPEKWTLNQTGMMGMSFALFSEMEGTEDRFRENVNLVEQDLSAYNLDLDQYMDLNLSQLKSMISNYDLKNSNRISGSPEYHKLVYSGTQGEFNLTFEQYFWIIGSKAYVLTFTAEQSQFEKYKQTGESILNSFELK